MSYKKKPILNRLKVYFLIQQYLCHWIHDEQDLVCLPLYFQDDGVPLEMLQIKIRLL